MAQGWADERLPSTAEIHRWAQRVGMAAGGELQEATFA
jgi:hypothetical protein